jgi:putative aminopeptidase FrvX
MNSTNNPGINFELLRRLSEAHGVPGHEGPVRELVRAELAGLVDSMTQDVMGNLVAFKNGAGSKKVLITAHMDEIGFVVRHIDDRGFLRLMSLGGFDTRNLFAREVVVQGREGELPGILQPAGRPVHIADPEERKKVPDMKGFFVDLGLDAAEVKRLVRIGDPVSLVGHFRQVGRFVAGKSLDDRLGVYVIIEVLRRLQHVAHYLDIYALFSTQEEIGSRGARVAGFDIAPDVAIAIDTTIGADIPGVGNEDSVTMTGHGVSITMADSLAISTPWLTQQFIAVAEKNNIKHQLNVLTGGGTDAGPIHTTRSGIPSVSLCLPSRYVHTLQEAVDMNDIASTIDLLVAWVLDG